MQCGRCRRKKLTITKSFGGVNVCDWCYNEVNPQTETHYLMSITAEEAVKRKIYELQAEIRTLEHRLSINDRIKESGQFSLTFKIVE